MKSLFLFVILTNIFAGSLFAQIRGQDEFDIKRFSITDEEVTVTREHLLMDRLDPLGTVKGSYLSGSFFSNDDLVYLKLKNQQVSVGDKMMIYQDNGPVEIPGKFQKYTGKDILVKGFAEVTKVQADAIIAKLYDCSMQIQVGDQIMSPIDLNLKLVPKEPSKMIRGIVLRSSKNLGIIGPYDYVYLNKGSKDGLEINDRLYVSKKAELNWDAGSKEKKPAVNVSELVVVHTGENVSTAYVLASENSFAPGSVFKSAISDVRFLNEQDLQAEAAAQPTTSPTDESEDEKVAEQEDFDFQNSSSYFLLGAGTFETIDRDGIHRPYFSAVGEFGGEKFAMPFKFNTLKSEHQEIDLGLTYHKFFQPFSSSQIQLVLGAGPNINYGFVHGKSLSGQTIELGIMLTAQARAYFSDTLFFFASPLEPTISFWHYAYAKTKGFKATTESEFDVRGRIYTSVGLGWNF